MVKFYFLLFYTILSFQKSQANVLFIEKQMQYKVFDVNVEEYGANLQIVKSNAINNAKRKAILELQYHVLNKVPDINFSDVEIDSIITSFLIDEEEISLNKYSAKITMYFDKHIFQSLLESKNKKKSISNLSEIGDESINVIIQSTLLKKIDERFVDFERKFKNKLDYKILSIQSDRITLLVNNINADNFLKLNNRDFQLKKINNINTLIYD